MKFKIGTIVKQVLFFAALFFITQLNNGLTDEINNGIMAFAFLDAFLWGIFCAWHAENQLNERTPKIVTVLLFIYSFILAIFSISVASYDFYSIVLKFLSLRNPFVLLLMPVLLTRSILLFSPCYIAVQLGKDLFKKWIEKETI